jgi:hypothetical protein
MLPVINHQLNKQQIKQMARLEVVTKNGELVRIYPPYKTSTSSFKTTISK